MDSKIIFEKGSSKARNQAIALLLFLYVLIALPVIPFLLVIRSNVANIVFATLLLIILLIHYQWTVRSVYKFLSVNRVDISELPAECQSFISSSFASLKLNTPQIGIIEDKNLNAFTFGRKKKPVIVVTRGLLQTLSPNEVNAVIAHEMGHIFYRDFTVMVMSMIVPILFASASWSAFRIRSANPALSGAGIFMGIVLGIFYWVSKITVLITSRHREFEADRFAAHMVGDPNILSKALLKITCGSSADMGRRESQLHESNGKKARALRKTISRVKAMSLLSISSNFYSAENQTSLLSSLNWEQQNYWARFYEIFSTHPLTAKRILNLNNVSVYLGVHPEIQVSQKKQKSISFLTEFFVWLAPWLLIPFLISGIPVMAMVAIMLLGLLLIMRLRLRYPKNFKLMSGYEILSNSHVSVIRSMPVLLDGLLLFEDSGSSWSRIFIEQDGHKIQLKIPKLNFTAREKLGQLDLKSVIVKGWYRRTPSPVILIKEVAASEGKTIIKLWSSGASVLRVLVYISIIFLAIVATALMYRLIIRQ
jgi:heat shock protein HtpX